MNWAEWSIAQIALIMSGLSLLLSFAAFVWSVWSHFIFPKPRLSVSAHTAFFDKSNSVAIFEHADGSLPSMWNRDRVEFPSLALSVINHGPGNATLNAAIARKSKLDDRSVWGTATLNPYNNYPSDMGTNGPHSGGLPKTLEPGEEFIAYFILKASWFTEHKFVKFGFLDTMKRKHFCSVDDLRALRRSVAREEKRGSA